jgi:peptidoglycan hydrolase CwlO-like protein
MGTNPAGLRDELEAIKDLISEHSADPRLPSEERTALLDFELFLGSLITQIDNQALHSQDAAIDALSKKFSGNAATLESAQKKIKDITKGMQTAQKVVDAFGGLLKKLKK